MKVQLKRSSYWNCGNASQNHTGRSIPGYLEAEIKRIQGEVRGTKRKKRAPVVAESAEALLASNPALAKLFAMG